MVGGLSSLWECFAAAKKHFSEHNSVQYTSCPSKTDVKSYNAVHRLHHLHGPLRCKFLLSILLLVGALVVDTCITIERKWKGIKQ